MLGVDQEGTLLRSSGDGEEVDTAPELESMRTERAQESRCSRPGVDAPSAAVVRNGGRTFLYVQTGDETFSRQEVRLDRPTRDGWFVASGLAAGERERVVVTGAQRVLSVELTGATAPGDWVRGSPRGLRCSAPS
jgi:hypothetical protein